MWEEERTIDNMIVDLKISLTQLNFTTADAPQKRAVWDDNAGPRAQQGDYVRVLSIQHPAFG